ncbi:hypothetical protein A9Q83_11980, partial [Alphaproteobacteria bacterium 46_93_T64]
MAKTENGIVTGTSAGTVLAIEEDQNILLDVSSPDLVVFSQDGSDLIITTIEDGSKIVLEGFFSQAATELPPQLTLSDGSVISASDVSGLVEAFDPSQVAPAAGGAGGADGGGAEFSRYTDDGIGNGISIEDLLLPTELAFDTQEEEEFLAGQDDTGGSLKIEFVTREPKGNTDADFVSGGFEDWNPNIHPSDPQNDLGSFPVEVLITFTAEDNEEITSFTLNDIPDDVEIFLDDPFGSPAIVVGGELELTVVDGVIQEQIYIRLPEDNDADIEIGYSATIVDPDSSLTNTLTGNATLVVDAVADEAVIDFADGSSREGDYALWNYNEDNAESSEELQGVACYVDGQPVYNVGFNTSVDDRDGSESITKVTLTPGVNTSVSEGSGFDGVAADGTGTALMTWVMEAGGTATEITTGTLFTANVEGVGSTTVAATSVSVSADGALVLTFDASLNILDLDLNALSIQLPQHTDDDVTLNLAVEVTETPTDLEASYDAPGGSFGGQTDTNNDGIFDENNVSIKTATLQLNVGAVADKPILSVSAGETNEDQPIVLNVEATFPDIDGSETHMITIDLPDGWAFISGEGWSDNDGTLTYTVSGDSYIGGPTVQPPDVYFGSASISVTATATETDEEGIIVHEECSTVGSLVITDSAIVTVIPTTSGSDFAVEAPGDGSHELSFDLALGEENDSGSTIRVYFELTG